MGLFKPAWQSDNEVKALMAVEKETDQAKLLEIAKCASISEVRCAAVQKLKDKNTLADFAKNSKDKAICHAAIYRLTDLWEWDILADAAINSRDKNICLMAANKSKGNSALLEIYLKSSDPAVREIAEQRYRSANMYYDMSEERIHIEWIKSLNNPSALAALAKIEPKPVMRSTAAFMIDDQGVLLEVAQNTEEDSYVRIIAVNRLTDKSILTKIIEQENVVRVRVAAQERLNQLVEYPDSHMCLGGIHNWQLYNEGHERNSEDKDIHTYYHKCSRCGAKRID